MTARLKDTYKNEVFKALQDKFQYKNVMEVPKLTKVTINMGLGEAKENPKILESAVKEIGQITGQKPVITKAKKSIANFKVRQTSRRQHVLFRRQIIQHFSSSCKRLQGRQQKLFRRPRKLFHGYQRTADLP